jgi:uroporphyrinogen decarboxylase
MTKRETIKNIIAGKDTSRCGFWMGHPHADTWPILREFFSVETNAEVRKLLRDDLTWLPSGGVYNAHDFDTAFPNPRKNEGLAAEGCFSDFETVDQLDSYPWPDQKYLDFTQDIENIQKAGDVYRVSGLWSPFFHQMANFFGMEEYFIKMYTAPELVHEATARTVEFFLEGTRRFFEEAGDEVDSFFFGNDFGTQLDLLVAPEQFEEFIFPYFKQLTDMAHDCGKHVFLHSCGSIYKVIPNLLELGVEVLHPLQAKAANMDADTLKQFKGQVTFFGGIDTQDLLVHGTPQQIKDDVRRVIDTLGPQLIVSPSHEALLPNVPPENILAMSEAVFC